MFEWIEPYKKVKTLGCFSDDAACKNHLSKELTLVRNNNGEAYEIAAYVRCPGSTVDGEKLGELLLSRDELEALQALLNEGISGGWVEKEPVIDLQDGWIKLRGEVAEFHDVDGNPVRLSVPELLGASDAIREANRWAGSTTKAAE